MTMGERIQDLRKRQGMSQEALAEQMQVSRQAVSKWERGEAMPDTGNVVQLSKLFQVSTDYLLQEGCKKTIQTTSLAGTEKTRRFKLKYAVGLGLILLLIAAVIVIRHHLRNRSFYGGMELAPGELIFVIINLIIIVFTVFLMVLLVKALLKYLKK